VLKNGEGINWPSTQSLLFISKMIFPYVNSSQIDYIKYTEIVVASTIFNLYDKVYYLDV